MKKKNSRCHAKAQRTQRRRTAGVAQRMQRRRTAGVTPRSKEGKVEEPPLSRNPDSHRDAKNAKKKFKWRYTKSQKSQP